MAFWIAAAFLTFGACLAIILPAMRARAAAPAAAHDIAVYRDQLAEVSRDAARGLIGASEAEEAKAEIGRRILRSGGADSAETAPRPVPRLSRALTAAAILAVPLVSWGMYSLLGSPSLPSQPLTARVSTDPAESSVEDLVARAEAHLAANPDDGRGWDVLAPIYVRLDRGSDAVAAYRNAIRLEGASAAREAGLGEALATEARRVTPEAKAAFQRALALEPGQPKAAFYMASALAQDGLFVEAAAAWRALLPSLAADSPWRKPTEQAIAEAEQRAGTAAPGPTASDVAAAQDMTPEDRLAMVQGMVAQLDAKLRENPKDAEGWRRLVRSYMVLGQEPLARDALSRGIAAFGAGTAEAAALTDFAAALGLPATDTN